MSGTVVARWTLAWGMVAWLASCDAKPSSSAPSVDEHEDGSASEEHRRDATSGGLTSAIQPSSEEHRDTVTSLVTPEVSSAGSSSTEGHISATLTAADAGGVSSAPDVAAPGNLECPAVSRSWQPAQRVTEPTAGTGQMSADGSVQWVGYSLRDDEASDVSRAYVAQWSEDHWGSPVRLSQNTTGRAGNIQVQASADGQVAMAVWSQPQTDGPEQPLKIYAAEWRQGDWSTPVAVSTNPELDTAQYGAMCLSSDGSTAVVGWVQEDDHDGSADTPTRGRPYAARWISGAWSEPVLLAEGSDISLYTPPECAVNADGSMMLAKWADTATSQVYGPVYAATWRDGRWSGPEQLSAPDAQDVSSWGLELNETGDQGFVLWRQAVGESSRRFWRRFANGQWAASPTALDVSGGDVAKCASPDGATVQLVSNGNSQGEPGVYTTSWHGAEWSTQQLVYDGGLGSLDALACALDACGRSSLVVWVQDDEPSVGDARHLYAAHGVDGVWEEPVRLFSTEEGETWFYVGSLVRDRAGNALLTWYSETGLWTAQFR